MRRWLLWALVAIAVVLIAMALYGPLFPWSPIKPGYTHFTLHRADIYYPAGTTLAEPYQKVDQFIEDAEQFHLLKMPDRVTVIAPSTWTRLHMQLPWQRGPVAGITLQTGTVIFITPKVAEKNFDVGEFLRHELSHAILDQNMTMWRGHQLTHEPWLYEGLAVDFGRQKAYLTETEFLERAKTQPLAPIFNGDNSDMRFNYVAWRCFVEYLMKTRGRGKFQDYLLRIMQNPADARAVFPEFFGVSFDGEVQGFEKSLRP